MDDIMHITIAVSRLLLLGKSVERSGTEPLAVVAFGVDCGIVAILVWMLEGCIFLIYGRGQMMDLTVGQRLGSAIMRPIASALTGMFALAIEIVQPSLPGCVAVALSWPAIFSVVTGRTSPETDLDHGGEPLERPIGVNSSNVDEGGED